MEEKSREDTRKRMYKIRRDVNKRKEKFYL